MKTNRIFLYAAALMMVVACGKEAPVEPVIPDEDTNDEVVVTPQPEYAVSFTAYTENAPESKATIGTNSNSRPQTFWENGDVISVYSSGQTTNSKVGFAFSTQLGSNSTSAVFGYDGEDFVGGNYIAVYPYRNSGRVVNFVAGPYGTGDNLPYEGDAYRIAMSDIPSTQTLVAGGFDRNAMMMTAYTEDPGELHFKNAVALVKFRVADNNVTSGEISTSEPISGRFRADLHLNDDCTPILIDYNQTTYKYVKFTSDAALTTGVDYYVAVRPTTLADGFAISLNDVPVKAYSATDVPAFERNKIYDLGTLTVPTDAAKILTLDFDFTNAAAMAAWPTVQDLTTLGKDVTYQMPCPYTLDGVQYTFISSQPKGVTTKSWPYFVEEEGNNRVVIPNQRYLGLPVIDGYNLTRVSFTVVSGNNSAYVVSDEVASGSNAPHSVGGNTQSGAKGTYTFDLECATQCWIKVGKAAAAISNMTLTYTPITK